MQVFTALGMGFRPDPNEDIVTHVDAYAPPSWKKLSGIPNILQKNETFVQRLLDDLPKNPDDPTDDPCGKYIALTYFFFLANGVVQIWYWILSLDRMFSRCLRILPIQSFNGSY